MASRVLRSIYRQAASCNWLCRKATSGSPIRSVSDRRLMSTVSDRISPAAATLPWLMLPPSYDYGGNMFNKLFRVGGKMDYKFYSPADDKVVSVSKRSSVGEEDKLNFRSQREAVVVGSSHGWLALYKSWLNWDMFLYNPISHRHIKLPPVETIPPAEEKFRDCMQIPFKVILSCSPDDDSNSCRAIMCYGPTSNMAMCCPGRSTEWTPFGAHFHENDEITKEFEEARVVRGYEDFVYSTTQKQLFCVTQYTDLEAWDLEDPLSPKLNWKKAEADINYDEETYSLEYEDEDEDEDVCVYPHLVFAEHSNQLFLVRRHVMRHMAADGSCVKPIYGGLHEMILDDTLPYKTIDFDIHVVDREKGELVYMDGTLDGMAFFIGSGEHGFVVESPETMNLKPNSIYFTDAREYAPQHWYQYKKYSGHDIGIFDYKNGTFSPCYYPCDVSKVKRIHPAPMWFTPSPSSSPSHV